MNLTAGRGPGSTMTTVEPLSQDDTYTAYVAATLASHRRVALLLTGNGADADDLVQHALVTLYLHWTRVSAAGDPGPYVRRVLTNRYIDQTRSARARRERVTDSVPEPLTEEALLADLITDQDALVAGLSSLSPRERAVLVHRFLEDRSISDVASIVGLSESQTKRYLRRGLRGLRTTMGER